MKMLKINLVATVGLALVIGLLASSIFAETASNQGAYGTNFPPATLTGKVTYGAFPISGATVSTGAGHLTISDGNGNYTLHLDSPGIYSVVAQLGSQTAVDSVEVFLGSGSIVDLDLAGPGAPAVPGVGDLGLVILALLLLAAFWWALRWRGRLAAGLGILLATVVVASLFLGREASAVTSPGYAGLSYTERGTLGAGTPGGLRVNTFSGNLALSRSLVFIPGKGLPFNPCLTYNSDHRLVSSPFGMGWNLSYNIRYTKDSAGSAFVAWGDGRVDNFTLFDSLFVPPAGVYLTLTEPVPGQLLLVTKHGIEFHFADSSHQKLTSIVDPNGNASPSPTTSRAASPRSPTQGADPITLATTPPDGSRPSLMLGWRAATISRMTLAIA